MSKKQTSLTGKAARGKKGLQRLPSSEENVMHLDTLLESRDFREFIELLNSNKVKYLIIGGYAVTFHGYPRYTGDLDFWVGNDHQNANHLAAALEEFGMGSLGLKPEDFQVPDTIVQMGYPPYRIDLITTMANSDFAGCFERRILVTQGSIELNLVSLEDLKALKAKAGRPKDLVDLENLR